jgi:copper oxidase (laccase) domain-containing protein
MSAVRECRLRREHAALYPGIEPEIWEVAANVVERLVTRRGPSSSAPTSADRLLGEGHFDFRGGRRPSRQGSRTRLGDAPIAR